MRRALPFLLAAAALPAPAVEQDPTVLEARRAQLEALRAEVAEQLQLQAFDLLDELVFGWTQQPVFATDTPVVLADVSVPVGFGSGLRALIENHFASVLVRNPGTHLVLAHCPECTAVVVHSTARGTVVARGVDQPEALAAAGIQTASRHALFLDFEAEGSALVLRARITSLTPALPILYAKTLSTTTSTPALLRSGDHLKSAEEARKEYLDALEGRGPVIIPLRIGVRTYASGNGAPVPGGGGIAISATPLVWLMGGAEISLTPARAWTASFSVGATWLPQIETGFMAQARIARLLTGSVSSLTHPDLYAFVGGSVTSLFGPGAALFHSGNPDLTQVLSGVLTSVQPQSTFGGLQVGLELRAKNRIGFAVFMEALPTLNDASSIGKYVDYGILQFQAFGAEVAFCF